MKRKQVFVGVMVVCLAFGMIVPTMAQTATPEVPTPQPTTAPLLVAVTPLFATSQFHVNVRSGPGTEYTVLGKLRPDDALDITGQTEDGNWLRVNFNGQEGWVLASLFEVTGDLTTAPVAEAGPTAVLRQAANQTINAQLGDVVVITRVNANFRASASTSADILSVIPFNTQLVVKGRTEGNNWVQVDFGNQTGWISSGTLFFSQGNITDVTPMDQFGNTVEVAPEPTVEPTKSA